MYWTKRIELFFFLSPRLVGDDKSGVVVVMNGDDSMSRRWWRYTHKSVTELTAVFLLTRTGWYSVARNGAC